jgi:hypothetical protein
MACCTARRSSRKLTKDGADNTRSRCSGVWMTDSSPRPLVHRSPLVVPHRASPDWAGSTGKPRATSAVGDRCSGSAPGF